MALEKEGYLPRMYIGSGTQATNNGLRSRLRAYESKSNKLVNAISTPKFVGEAVADDFQIVHKGVLIYSPVPSPVNVPIFRLLLVALEATLAFYFWTIYSQQKTYGGMLDYCGWSRTNFQYRELCSHNPMLETVSGNFILQMKNDSK